MAIDSQRRQDARPARDPPVEGNQILYNTHSNQKEKTKEQLEDLRRNDMYLEQCSAEQIDTIIRWVGI